MRRRASVPLALLLALVPGCWRKPPADTAAAPPTAPAPTPVRTEPQPPEELGAPGAHPGLTALAFSPDGRLLATAQHEKRVKVWDVATRKPVATLTAFKGVLAAVAFSPDGTTLAVADGLQEVRLFAVGSWKDLATLTGHRDVLKSLAFSPDGRVLASGDAGGGVALWDVAGRQNLHTLGGYPGAVTFLAFSPDGRTLYTGSCPTGAGELRSWSVQAGREAAAAVRVPRESFEGSSLSPDGKVLASTGTVDRAVKLYALPALESLPPLTGLQAPPKATAFARDGRLLAAADLGSVRVWETAGWKQVAEFKQEGVMPALAFAPDGKLLVSGGYGLHLWDTPSAAGAAGR